MSDPSDFFAVPWREPPRDVTQPEGDPSGGCPFCAYEWSPDELRVLRFIADRLHKGRTVYGPIELATDRRDLVEEAAEEAADLVVYAAMNWLKRRR